eukprot:snap_masked-scaffold_6-processed-gene-14.8-mRNA-1 protein AED:1.00 eAED:1.00 QI:0/0/0/0/1/1/2/0/60
MLCFYTREITFFGFISSREDINYFEDISLWFGYEAMSLILFSSFVGKFWRKCVYKLNPYK